MSWESKLQYIFVKEEIWDVDDSDDTILRDLAEADEHGVNTTLAKDEVSLL